MFWVAIGLFNLVLAFVLMAFGGSDVTISTAFIAAFISFAVSEIIEEIRKGRTHD